MIFQRVKAEGLAHNSYFIGSGGEAAVIDPRRDCQVYLDFARRHALRITRILETHRNEDYVIGSRELAAVTRADIFHGIGLQWKYGNVVSDGQEFRAGALRLTALHTPGHTDESMSYVLVDTASGPASIMVFTGDALFVGDVGRTDLYGPEETPRLASALYDSLFKRILSLGDGTILCPAHGAGSVCGMNIANRDESTLGTERVQNPVLQMKDRDEFVRYKVREKPEKPYYFSRMEKLNLDGPPVLGQVPLPVPLAPAAFKKAMDDGAMVVDTNMPAAFGGAHIKGACSIWLDGLASFAGWVLPYDKPVLLVLEDTAHLETAVNHLIRTGYDSIAGYLRGGTEAWYERGFPVEGLPLITVHVLKDMLARREKVTVLDVRDQAEWESGHIDGSVHAYVGYLEKNLSEVPRDRPVVVLCSVGHRAGLAASILFRAGYERVYNVLGGIAAWHSAGYPLTKE